MAKNFNLGLFLTRLGLGLVFVAHGWAKIMNIKMTEGFFGSLGLPFPIFFVILVAFVEFVGGIAMIAGLMTRWFGLFLAINMFFAIYLVRFKMGFVGGYEFELVLLLASLGIACMGGGDYSLVGLKKYMKK